MTEPENKDRGPLATSLCAVAAACLIYAAFTHTWLVSANRYAELGFGLRSNHECAPDVGWTSYSADSIDRAADRQPTCTDDSNANFIAKWKSMGSEAEKLTSAAFVPAGWITFIIVLLAAAGLVAAAIYGALKRPMNWPIAPTTIALLGVMMSLITGCVFVATKPGPAGMVGVGLSFWIFGVGCVMGIAGAQLMARANRPPDEEWTVD